MRATFSTFSLPAICFLFSSISGLTCRAAEQREPDSAITDEIVISGQRSILNLRMQVSEAEDLMYDLFNDINTEDFYDIHCSFVTTLGSHMKEKRCLPRYALDAMEDEAKALLGWKPSPEVSAVLNNYNPRMEEKLKQAIKDNPALFEAVIKHHELREQLNARRDSYFADADDE